CGYINPLANEKPEEGGLNRLDRETGKFTRFFNVPGDPTSLANSKINALFEDSKGNFWVGTAGNGLHIMNRATGEFTRYPYDPLHPEKLSGPPLAKGSLAVWNSINMITEDSSGNIWISGLLEGMNRYDPVSKTVTHFGDIVGNVGEVLKKDTLSGFNDANNNSPLSSITSKDGLLWMGTQDGNLYKVSLTTEILPYHKINESCNNFFLDEKETLWIATDNCLISKNRRTGLEKKFHYTAGKTNSISSNGVNAIRPDYQGNLWLSTLGGGICKYDPRINLFTSYKHDPADPKSLSMDSTYCIYIDNKQQLWVGTYYKGLDKMDKNSGHFIHYKHNEKDVNSLINDEVICITGDSNNGIWLGTKTGLDRLDLKTGRFDHYIGQHEIVCVTVDASGEVWAGAADGLYRFNSEKNVFAGFSDQNTPQKITHVVHILEDDHHNLWVSTDNAIIKINETRNAIRIFGEHYGVKTNTFYLGDNYKSKSGELFIGDQSGYYSFFPEQVGELHPPQLQFAALRIGEEEILPGTGSILNEPIWKTNKLKLTYKQSTFSFEFNTIDFRNVGSVKYLFILENFNDKWHDLGTDRKAYFFNVPPGKYILRVKAINSEGLQDEKHIQIIISPPWWQTWWFRSILGVTLLFLVYGFYRWRTASLRQQKRKLEETVKVRTAEVVKEKEKSDELLLNILPSEVADELKEKGYTTAKSFDEVTVLFSDIKGFTNISEKMTARELVKEINHYFSAFDRIMQQYNLEKIKTIGDAYIAAGGLLNQSEYTANQVIKAAIAMQQTVEEFKQERIAAGKPFFEMRIGIHTGPVVAGVVGIKKFQYDIWGDTVNLAARMEQSGVPGKINISEHTYEIVKDFFHCVYRGKIDAKNKGEIDMYFVE
ncbi:MAG TPA: adenylate/guanylate cyclase domain-containing protein, partial [Chitinophagaceae bacterium]|nr:adenylate/guanylate cyclase domain-containing protein [Chitinophagaceae bacterium]